MIKLVLVQAPIDPMPGKGQNPDFNPIVCSRPRKFRQQPTWSQWPGFLSRDTTDAGACAREEESLAHPRVVQHRRSKLQLLNATWLDRIGDHRNRERNHDSRTIQIRHRAALGECFKTHKRKQAREGTSLTGSSSWSF